MSRFKLEPYHTIFRGTDEKNPRQFVLAATLRVKMRQAAFVTDDFGQSWRELAVIMFDGNHLKYTVLLVEVLDEQVRTIVIERRDEALLSFSPEDPASNTSHYSISSGVDTLDNVSFMTDELSRRFDMLVERGFPF